MKLILILITALSLTACGSTPQERQASAAAFGAVVGGVAAGAGAYYGARYSQPVYVQPVYVRPPSCVRFSNGSGFCN